MAEPVLQLRALSKAYQVGGRPLPVLKSLDLDVHQGEFTSIMGSSGSGKSTLLNVLGLLDRYDSGTYHLGGVLAKDLSERRAAQLRNRMLGFVFQAFHLIPYKNAWENVALPLTYQRVHRKERYRRAMAVLERVELADRADHLPGELSGGQKQRVAIARALVSEPTLILADEPTGALDSATSHLIIDLLEEVADEGRTVVVVTHEPDIAERTRRIVRLHDGVIADDRLIPRRERSTPPVDATEAAR
ncbi:MAG: ABC transporter ATP-binding protein [Deltaproteobacteria bacterium]|nr:MAG: ABC transporter ATP-binding protein [Deltaproteobacteria bacterium]